MAFLYFWIRFWNQLSHYLIGFLLIVNKLLSNVYLVVNLHDFDTNSHVFEK